MTSNTLGNAFIMDCSIGKDFLDPHSKTRSMGGPCISVEQFLNLKSSKSAGKHTCAWYMPGNDFHRFQIALPRVMAAIWGDDQRYRRYRMLVRDNGEMRREEVIFLKHLDSLNMQEKTISLSQNPEKVSAEKELVDTRAELARIAKQIADKQASKSMSKKNALLELSGGSDGNGLYAIVDLLNRISYDSADEPNADIIRVLEKIDEVVAGGALDTNMRELLNRVRQDLSQSIEELGKWEAESNDRIAILRDFKKYFQGQSELILPGYLKFNLVSSDLLDEIYVTREGFVVPFAKRPNIDDLYHSWSKGESSIPTFTPSSGPYS
jgi:hypothetical protein